MTLNRIQTAIITIRNGAFASPANRNPKLPVFLPHPGIMGAIILCFAFCFPAWAGSQSVTFAWNAASGATVAGYYLHYGTASQNYSSRIDAGANTTITVPGLASGSTYYFAATTYDIYGNESLPSNEASFTTSSNNLPVITSQPVGSTNLAGSTASFAVSATGGGLLSYQWLKNTAPIPGDTLATLALANVSDADAASYSVVVSNATGTAVSSAVTLTVIDPPTIVNRPVNATNVAGTTAVFSFSVRGSAPLNYQWWKNSTPLSGATAATLTLASVSDADAASYTLAVSNRAGFATSSVVTLTVLDPPVITSRLASRTNVAGTTAAFSVSVSGAAPLNYQWWKNTAPLGGATAAVLTLTHVSDADAANYTLVVSNQAGFAISSIATLTVLDPPVILTGPLSQTNMAGSNATFAVLAGGTPPLTYQWLENAGPILGATNSSLALTNISATTAGSFAVIVSNPAGSVTSAPAVLTIIGIPPTGGGGAITKSMAHTAPGNPVPAVPALFIIPGSKAGDPMTLRFYAAPAHSYELQSTADLKLWTTLGKTGVAAENSWVEFKDVESCGYSARFYRVVCH